MDESEFPGGVDWLSEEKYNLLKEKYNMTKRWTQMRLRSGIEQ